MSSDHPPESPEPEQNAGEQTGAPQPEASVNAPPQETGSSTSTDLEAKPAFGLPDQNSILEGDQIPIKTPTFSSHEKTGGVDKTEKPMLQKGTSDTKSSGTYITDLPDSLDESTDVEVSFENRALENTTRTQRISHTDQSLNYKETEYHHYSSDRRGATSHRDQSLNVSKERHHLYDAPPPEDPTERITVGSSELLAGLEGTVEHARGLTEHGVLVITSPSISLLRKAGRSVLAEAFMTSPGIQMREYFIGTPDSMTLYELVRYPGCICPSKKHETDGGHNAAVLVVADNEAAIESTAQAVRHLLNGSAKDRRLYFVVLVPTQRLGNRVLSSMIAGAPCWELDTSETLLRLFAPEDEEAIRLLREDLAVAQAEHRWSVHELDLAGELAEELAKDGWAGLQREIANKNRRLVRPPLEEARRTFRAADKIGKAAIFLSATFPGITFPAYQRLMEVLLKDEKIDVPAVPPVDKDGNPNPPKPEDAYPRWRKTMYELNEQLGLRTPEMGISQSASASIGFEKENMRWAFSQCLPAPYVLEQVQRLHGAFVWFHQETTDDVANLLGNATLPLFTLFPDTFNANWLAEREAEVGHISRVSEAVSGAVEMNRDEDTTQEGLDRIEKLYGRPFYESVCRRLTEMCNGLLVSPNAKIVDYFLHQIIRRRSVVELLRRLAIKATDTSFDVYWWTKHLLETGKQEMKLSAIALLCHLGSEQFAKACIVASKTYSILPNLRRESSRRLWQMLQQVRQWHPPREKVVDVSRLSGSQLWSLCIIYAVFLQDKAEAESLRRGGRPPELPCLFAPDDEELPLMADRLKYLADWLSHPALPAALERSFEYTNYEPRWDLQEGHAGSAEWSKRWIDGTLASPDSTIGETAIAQMIEGWHAFGAANEVQALGSLIPERLPERTFSKNAPGPVPRQLRRAFRWLGERWSYWGRNSSRTERDYFFRRRNAAYELANLCVPNPPEVSS